MVKILVDRGSVEHNPRSGSTALHYECGPAIHKRETHEVSEDGKKWVITKQETIRTNNIQTMHTLSPGAPFLFKYLPQLVQCVDCFKVFDWSLLKNHSYFDEDEDIWTDTECPHCGNWDCCDIEFEKLSEPELRLLAI